MSNEKQIHTEVVDIDDLIQDDHNFNKGTEEGAELIGRSFKEHGAGRSVFIDKNNRLVGGNKAQKGFKGAGYRKVVIIDSDPDTLVAVRRKDVDLDTREGREMALLDNLTTERNLQWDPDELAAVETEVPDFDAAEYGWEPPTMDDETEEQAIERKRREFEEKMAAGELDENDPEYQEFIKKFEAKRTTDDCYTPEVVYDAVAEYVASEYGVSRANFVRPFYPGGDYQREKYKPTDIVVDNPPFSILASIIDWYSERGIRYFLFGPQLTMLGTCTNRCTCLAVGVQITYANGANVNTSFCTNMDDKDIAVKADARLYKMVNDANLSLDERKKFPKYVYPKNVIMSPFMHQCAKHGVDFIIRKSECHPIEELDAQAEAGKAIYGKGYLVSDRVVERRIEAERIKEQHDREERDNAQQWELSERERAIIEGLNQNK